MKRGIQTQFTWIFILIAGAVILTFFITIGYRQQAVSEEKLSIQLEQTLDSIISAALQSPGTSLSVPTPSSGIGFSCTQTCDCNLYVGSKGTEFGEKIYFAPALIEESEMILWTQYWNVPFRATNFLYVIDPRTTYYFVSTSTTESLSLRDRLLEIIPPQTNTQFIDISEVTSVQNSGPARFIFLRSGKDALDQSFAGEIIYGVEIIDDSVQFLLKDEDQITFELVGQQMPILNDNIPMILGAAFSRDQFMYSCGMQHAYQKQALVAQIFEERARLLDGHDNRCFYIGPAAITPLQELQSSATNLTLDITSTQHVLSMNALITQLDKRNEEKIIDGCPALY